MGVRLTLNTHWYRGNNPIFQVWAPGVQLFRFSSSTEIWVEQLMPMEAFLTKKTRWHWLRPKTEDLQGCGLLVDLTVNLQGYALQALLKLFLGGSGGVFFPSLQTANLVHSSITLDDSFLDINIIHQDVNKLG